jgi:choline dehydrogenase-like flavoprotein
VTAPADPGAPEDPEGTIWDVVVVGTGAGGATAGYSAAANGKSVLFLERGRHLSADPAVVRGRPFTWRGGEDAALRHGWWPRPVFRREGVAEAPEPLPVGCGTGGSTALFGMVMDRLRPADFAPGQYFPDAGASSLPEAWPIDYPTLDPFYGRAERLYGVCGTGDPLLPGSGADLPDGPPPTAKERAVSEALSGCGLHPYRIHYARSRAPDCALCPGMLCDRACRNDAGRTCLEPAVLRHGARVLTGCQVLTLEAKGRSVTAAMCDWNGRRIAVRGRVFVLAAGALLTPAILLRSASAAFPGGLANSSGLVGRNLMLHVSDFFLLRLRRSPLGIEAAMHHGLSLNDFYVHGDVKLGNIHAHAVTVAPETTQAFLQLHQRWINRLPGRVRSAIASAAAYLQRGATVFATVVEDLPYAENRVTPRPWDDGEVTYEYRYPAELRDRNRRLLSAFRAAVAPRFSVQPIPPLGSVNLGHACGTCRFGDDPATSVLDRNNRTHDLDNLYVVDASFFPSSGGINPSLTIAANALRVGELIAARA